MDITTTTIIGDFVAAGFLFANAVLQYKHNIWGKKIWIGSVIAGVLMVIGGILLMV